MDCLNVSFILSFLKMNIIYLKTLGVDFIEHYRHVSMMCRLHK